MKLSDLTNATQYVELTNGTIIERDDHAAKSECRGMYNRRGGSIPNGSLVAGRVDIFLVRVPTVGTTACSGMAEAISEARRVSADRIRVRLAF